MRETVVALLLSVAIGPAARASDLDQLAWLAGCWAGEGGEGSGEQWMPPAGDTMLGVSRTVRDGKTVAYEFLMIRPLEEGRLGYVSKPSGQPENSFPLLRMSDGEVVFEDLEHDFPQRIIYRRGEGGALPARIDARIEGLRGGTLQGVDFPFRRVDCDSWSDDRSDNGSAAPPDD